MKTLKLLLLFIFVASQSFAQISFEVGTVSSTANETVNIPISADFSEVETGVGSMTIYISYNPNVLEFNTIDNLNSAFVEEVYTGGPFEKSDTLNYVLVAWYSVINPLTINDVLFDLVFDYSGGYSDIKIDQSRCIISNAGAIPIIDITYKDGYVTEIIRKTVVTIPSITAFPNTIVNIPIIVEFPNVGSFDFYIRFDPSVLKLVDVISGYERIGSPLWGLQNDSTLLIAWFAASIEPVIHDGLLLTLQFEYFGGCTDIEFTDNSLIGDIGAMPLFDAVFNNGSICEVDKVYLKLESINSVADTLITIPMVADFSEVDGGVGAITSYINFDTNHLEFVDFEVATSTITDLQVLEIDTGLLQITWYSVTNTLTFNDELVDLHFNYFGGNTSLIFNEGWGAVSNNMAEFLQVEYTNANIFEIYKATIGIQSAKSRAGAHLMLPVIADLSGVADGVGYMDVSVEYDIDILTFNSITEVNTLIEDLSIYHSNGILRFVILNETNTLTFNDKVFYINFTYTIGDTDIVFDIEKSKILTSLGIPMKVTYVNSIITELDDTSTEYKNISNIKVYPNPTNNYIHIDSPLRIKSVHIINNVGQVVLLDDKNEINVSQLNNGIYHIRIFTELDTTMLRFIKQN